MTRKYFDVKTVTGTYTNEDGEVKKKWETVGFALTNSDGSVSINLKKTFNPSGVPFTDVWLNLFEQKPKAPF